MNQSLVERLNRMVGGLDRAVNGFCRAGERSDLVDERPARAVE